MASGIYNEFKLLAAQEQYTVAASKNQGRPLTVAEMRKKAQEAKESLLKSLNKKVQQDVANSDEDEELRCLLDDIDASEKEVTAWEANFIESILSQDRPLTPKQKAVIEKMAEEYL